MDNYDDARAERDYRKNPPKNAPGQSTGDEWDIDFDDTGSSMTDENAFMGSDNMVGSVLDNMDNNNQNQRQNNGFYGDDGEWAYIMMAWKALKAGAKGGYAFVEAMINSFKNNTEGDWHRLGVRMNWVSIICISIGLVLMFIKIFIPTMGQPQTLVCGGCITFMIGMLLSAYNDKDDSVRESLPVEEPIQDSIEDFSQFSSDFSFEDEEVEVESTPSSDDFDWSSYESDFYEEDEVDEEAVVMTGVGTEGFDIQKSIDSIRVEQPGIWTRQYLFELYCSVLPNVTPSYAHTEVITDTTSEFMMFSEYIRGAAIQLGIREENIPELEEIRKSLFIIQLRATRPTVAKEQEIADAVADMYSRDENGKVVKDGVYATVDSMIGVFIINIFTGNTAMVSLRDIYDKIPNFIKDVEVKMPFVWGISEMGDPYYCDLINCDSILISGEGRGGKSWKGQSIMAQLAMYNSPKELEFYVYDHKDAASDYRFPSTVLPHVKYFCGDPKKINKGLKDLIDYTMESTGKILAKEKCLNIKDYNRRHPNDKLPYRYIVIDEMMSLMDGYDKDQQAEFRGYMSTIVSKLPYLGLRLILFPHRIVDYVISKNTYSLISSRAVVRQLNEEEVKSAVGVTRRQFPYKLTNMGDMAVRSKEIANGEAVFCHAEVLSKTNEDNKELFRFIGSVWSKLCPECQCLVLGDEDSVGGRIGDKVDVKLKKADRKPVDHTAGREEYQYEGYDVNEALKGIDEALEGLQDDDDSEDFWDSIINNQ